MVRGKKTKTTALVLTAICMIVCLAIPSQLLAQVGICKDCSIFARFAYPFFHASFMHMAINCWCLLSVVFIYDVPLAYLAIAYAIAVTYPIDTFSAVIGSSLLPTVGLSGVDYALLGMVSFQAKRKLYFHTFIVTSIAFGATIPYLCSICGYPVASPNNLLHIYCYVAGLLVGFLNSPAHG